MDPNYDEIGRELSSRGLKCLVNDAHAWAVTESVGKPGRYASGRLVTGDNGPPG